MSEQGLTIRGRVVFVKPGKVEKDGKVTEWVDMQLLIEGNGTRARLENVRSMGKDVPQFGAELSVPVSYDLYKRKSGEPGIQFTHWPGNAEGAGKSASSGAGTKSPYGK